jgi:hypothetical protein
MKFASQRDAAKHNTAMDTPVALWTVDVRSVPLATARKPTTATDATWEADFEHLHSLQRGDAALALSDVWPIPAHGFSMNSKNMGFPWLKISCAKVCCLRGKTSFVSHKVTIWNGASIISHILVFLRALIEYKLNPIHVLHTPHAHHHTHNVKVRSNYLY